MREVLISILKGVITRIILDYIIKKLGKKDTDNGNK